MIIAKFLTFFLTVKKRTQSKVPISRHRSWHTFRISHILMKRRYHLQFGNEPADNF